MQSTGGGTHEAGHMFPLTLRKNDNAALGVNKVVYCIHDFGVPCAQITTSVTADQKMNDPIEHMTEQGQRSHVSHFPLLMDVGDRSLIRTSQWTTILYTEMNMIKHSVFLNIRLMLFFPPNT